MIMGAYSHARSPRNKMILLSMEDGMGIFEDKSGMYPARIKCPVTPDFVIPYAERSEIIEKEEPKNES